MNQNEAIREVLKELGRAQSKFPTMRSFHEGYAILLEEVEELWEEIKSSEKKNPNRAKNIKNEAIQVAAMAVRFLIDLCSNEVDEK